MPSSTPKTPTKTTTPAKKTTTTATAKAVVQTPVAAPKAMVVETVTAVVADAPIKKPEFIDRVVAETGMKKKDVKPVVEAMLAVLGRALSDGEELTMPPLGKLMIKRVKEAPNAKILTLKLRHPNGNAQAGGGAGKGPMSDAAE